MTNSSKRRIFISYRRADSAGYAGRIYDRLTAHFGVDAIFMDVDTIEAGLDFVDVLQNAVQSCEVLVALIGRRWLDVKDETGKRRLDNPEDFVRIEVAAALDRDIRVIPVLVDGPSMPRSTELPGNLQPLARRNALRVDHASFNADIRRLISQLELALKAAEDSRILKARKLEAEKARLEEKERKQKETEEKARIDEETREKEKAKERARLAAEQKARQEHEERQQKKAEERARKTALRKARLEEAAERIKNIFSSGNKSYLFIGVSIVIVASLIFGINYIIQHLSVKTAPEDNSAYLLFTAAAQTVEAAQTGAVQLTQRAMSTLTSASTETPTKIPPSPTPTLGVGSTMISEKDGMVMVYVPAGDFHMGSEDGEDDEKPVHTVYLDAFWIDQTEVTNEMFVRFLNDIVMDTTIEDNEKVIYGGITIYDLVCTGCENWDERIFWVGGRFSVFDGYEKHPTNLVTWYGADNYCKWVGRRLPTEAEWEKAASWDEDFQAQRVYPWGDNFDCNKGNFDDETQQDEYVVPGGENCDGFSQTAPIESFSTGVSFYNAFDMAGNVWEWVADWYDSGYYNNSPNSNPAGPSSGVYRVSRGGSWVNSNYFVRSTKRFINPPTFVANGVGFRCALNAE